MELIAIGYPDTFTASLAMEDLEGIGRDLVIREDEIAVIVRAEDGVFTMVTNAVINVDEAPWSMFWGPLFANLFFVPMIGMSVGAGLEPIVEDVRRMGLDPLFEERVRRLVAPGTSALFVLVGSVRADVVVEALEEYGGTVLQSEIPQAAEERLEAALGRGAQAS